MKTADGWMVSDITGVCDVHAVDLAFSYAYWMDPERALTDAERLHRLREDLEEQRAACISGCGRQEDDQ